MLNIEAHRVCVGVFYARLSLKHNSRTKIFSQLSSAGHALGKKQNSARFMSKHYVSSVCFFFYQFLVTILVLLVILNFYFPYFKFAKLVSDGVESNPGPNINDIGIYENSKYEIVGLKESFFAICYSADKSVSVWEKTDIDFIRQYQSDNFGRIPVNRHFSIDELLKFVKIHDHIFEVQKIWHHVNVFKNISGLLIYHNTLTTCDIGDDAVLIYKGSSIAVIWEKRFTYVFKSYIDVNLKLRTVHLKFGSVGAVRNFASNFCSEQVVPYGSDEYSIAYFKISPPGIDKIDFQLQLIPYKQSKESFSGDSMMSLSPMVCNMKSDMSNKSTESCASQPFKVKKAVLGTLFKVIQSMVQQQEFSVQAMPL